MSRIIWFCAGFSMAINGLVDAAKGPHGFLDWADPTVWIIVFIAGSLGWLYLAIEALRGRF